MIHFVLKAWLWNYTLLLPCTLAVSHQALVWLPGDDQKPIPATATSNGCALWHWGWTEPPPQPWGSHCCSPSPRQLSRVSMPLGWALLNWTHKISQRPFIDHSRNIPTSFFGCCILQCVHLKYIRGHMWKFKTIAKRTLDEIKTEKHAQVNLLKIQGLNVTFLTWKNSSVYLTKTFY